MELRILDGPFSGHIIKTYEFAGLRLVDRVYSAKTKVPKHSHQYAVFCVGLTGMCSEVFAGKVRPYEASTVEYLPPDQCHSLDFPFADTRAFSIEIATSWIESAREFRRFHGCTIGEYIRRLRVERACRQLSSSDESLATIAAGAGFSDQSHFSRTFKRLMGMTPTQYRANFDTH